MYTVTDAKFLRLTEMNGTTMAEVEVSVAERSDGLKVYLYPTANGYEAAQVMSNEANYDLDWYDNDLHRAFSDVTDQALGNTASAVAQNTFVSQVISAGNVQSELDQYFY